MNAGEAAVIAVLGKSGSTDLRPAAAGCGTLHVLTVHGQRAVCAVRRFAGDRC